MIVSSDGPVTLVGGAALRRADLDLALRLAPVLVAADGGADAVLAAGLVPQAVIGDMDSLSPAAAAAFDGLLHPVTEQETTDFDKALRHVAAPLVLALGVTGGRMDHELAMLNVLVRHAHRACIAIGTESIVFHCPPDVALDLAKGDLVSLFPMVRLRVASKGLVWPTEGLELAPDGRIGTSNAAVGPVSLRPDRPGLLVVLARGALDVAVGALAGGARWPDANV